MKNWLIRQKWTLLGAFLGAVLGYLYWLFYGCLNGCSITGSALNSTLYFMVLGALFPGLFRSEKRVTKNIEVDRS